MGKQNTKTQPLFDIDEHRITRNRLLKASDEMMLPDRPTNKDVWIEYRQLLRELPEQEGFPDNIVWPEIPHSN